MKENKGITLIALMVTVIILLVLAAITISTVNDGEIIGKAENEYNSVDNLASKYNELLKGEGGFLNETYNGLDTDLEHTCSWNQGEVTTDATCTTTGVRTYTCTVCGAIKTESIAKLGHNYKDTVTTAATCTTQGVITTTCTNSGCTYKTTKTTNALGHNIIYEVCKPIEGLGIDAYHQTGCYCNRSGCNFKYTDLYEWHCPLDITNYTVNDNAFTCYCGVTVDFKKLKSNLTQDEISGYLESAYGKPWKMYSSLWWEVLDESGNYPLIDPPSGTWLYREHSNSGSGSGWDFEKIERINYNS